MSEEQVEYTTIRAPVDVADKIKVLAAIKGISMGEWNHTRLRQFVDREYAREMDREARKSETGNPVG